ncbi:MAG: undecaprenyl-diphosphate phosphatase [Treponema sp.]|jgi:undecaprenyl-diphosphatase|nr:undecaprenyl-diphosphate phosphatase [Treponema sp.]
MNVVEALILGVIQGITEFLPVSSSGHLVLFQHIFEKIRGVKFAGPPLLFDTMVHAGTLVAVFIVLRKDILALLRRPIQPLTAYLVIGTLPAVVLALAFGDVIEKTFDSGNFLGFAFLITSALLLTAELLSRRPVRPDSAGQSTGKENMNWLDALIIGLLQGVAIIPGVSRSGATLSGALSRKLSRDFAARFSFLLSIPAILGALILQIWKLIKIAGPESAAAEGGGAGIGLVPVLAGTIAAAVVGFFSIRFMLKIIRERTLTGFAIYTAILGALVLADQFVSRLFF